MPKPSLSRETLLPRLAAHVLEHGLSRASLRPLARAAGTSDRMLIYHFGSKAQLLADLLAFVADLYAEALDSALGHERAATRQEVAARVLARARADDMQRFMALWWEIVAGSARGLPGYREAAGAVMDRMLRWLEGQMPAGDPDPQGGARYLLTLIEGAMMLSAAGRPRIAREGLIASGL